MPIPAPFFQPQLAKDSTRCWMLSLDTIRKPESACTSFHPSSSSQPRIQSIHGCRYCQRYGEIHNSTPPSHASVPQTFDSGSTQAMQKSWSWPPLLSSSPNSASEPCLQLSSPCCLLSRSGRRHPTHSNPGPPEVSRYHSPPQPAVKHGKCRAVSRQKNGMRKIESLRVACPCRRSCVPLEGLTVQA